MTKNKVSYDYIRDLVETVLETDIIIKDDVVNLDIINMDYVIYSSKLSKKEKSIFIIVCELFSKYIIKRTHIYEHINYGDFGIKTLYNNGDKSNAIKIINSILYDKQLYPEHYKNILASKVFNKLYNDNNETISTSRIKHLVDMIYNPQYDRDNSISILTVDVDYLNGKFTDIEQEIIISVSDTFHDYFVKASGLKIKINQIYFPLIDDGIKVGMFKNILERCIYDFQLQYGDIKERLFNILCDCLCDENIFGAVFYNTINLSEKLNNKNKGEDKNEKHN